MQANVIMLSVVEIIRFAFVMRLIAWVSQKLVEEALRLPQLQLRVDLPENCVITCRTTRTVAIAATYA